MSEIPRPGEVYRLCEDERPIIVVSRAELNKGKYVVVVPVTSSKFKERSKLPNCVPFRKDECGFGQDCIAQTEGITVRRIASLDLQRGCVGRLNDERMRDLIRAVGDMMGAECEPEP